MPTPYTELLAGTQEIVSTQACFADSGELKAFTPLMMNADGLVVPWDGADSGMAVYLTPHAINTTSQRRAKVYKTGVFNIDVVNWPDTVTTAEKKMAAFIGSGISVQPLCN
ncbi:head decoration protein [Salmonella enterica subsp. enterica serovar Glostrup]|nr:head decoration protein [Salmonella enterica subsp. enterica serovar Glostrup]